MSSFILRLKQRARSWPAIRQAVAARHWLRTRIRLARARARGGPRRLEIGAGGNRIPGFESLDVDGRTGADYVHDTARRLPFGDGTFEVVYASHVLEHLPWYQTRRVLSEWVRVLAPGGRLEVWVPNGYRICKALVDAEERGTETHLEDGWFRFNPEHDVYLWAAGRLFTYGDGTGTWNHPNWHRALFTPKFLLQVLREAGLRDERLLRPDEVRGVDHGWINLGATGTRP